MKLVSFGERGSEMPGVLVGEKIVPLTAAMHSWGYDAGDMNDVLRHLPTLRSRIRELADAGTDAVPVDTTRLGAPVPNPGSIFAVGANYAEHIAELAESDLPSKPILFTKTASSLAGPTDSIEVPAETTMLDYEVELAVVVGRTARRITADAASEYIAGYMIANDVTARDVFLGESHKNPLYLQILRGKGYDTFCPTGPWLVTADEVDNVADLRLQLWVNDELRQDDTCAKMIFDVPHIVASVSEFVTLHPGDIILTGTPSGVGMTRQPPEFLTAGDTVRLEITGLGTMCTPVIDEIVAPTSVATSTGGSASA
jgi:2-keto-4-pentenoate hydratase/2-oxohepta-3-ene-1,7-dioic acid hydratase in catechol pathway